MIVSRSLPAQASHGSGGIIAPRSASDADPGGGASRSALRVRVQWPELGVVVVSVGGEIDMASLPRITEVVRQRLTAAHLHTAIVDLHQVGFASSAVLELLMLAYNAAGRREARLLVVPGCGRVSRLLELTGLSALFEQATSVDDALARARQ
ncbi:STAS domain-containing protein [Saccharopolyspora endophytica]|uniref:Anti-sigma factor antagonist n=1 Tax=Saccharopolyspora endophytica TaxID=543886 RepID=A0ABS5DCS4_9PSEU|nr:STAS domain-containing protein [Saccharopolyspora endophytica]MBQ0924081.1 STAS domain-containing protein [Saccharopolyspora endophytica]